jgi:hypothetical protein
MSPGSEAWLVFFGLMATMLAGVFLIFSAIRHRSRSLEMAHKERMAMIEKGVVPSPEMDPGHRAWASAQAIPPNQPRLVDHSPAQRSTTLGIVIVAIALGFMSIIGIAAETPSVALGIGGAILIVGVAFIVIGQVRRAATGQPFGVSTYHSVPPIPGQRPPSPPEPPSNASSL